MTTLQSVFESLPTNYSAGAIYAISTLCNWYILHSASHEVGHRTGNQAHVVVVVSSDAAVLGTTIRQVGGPDLRNVSTSFSALFELARLWQQNEEASSGFYSESGVGDRATVNY